MIDKHNAETRRALKLWAFIKKVKENGLHISCDEEGRYVIKDPWNDHVEATGNSLEEAVDNLADYTAEGGQ